MPGVVVNFCDPELEELSVEAMLDVLSLSPSGVVLVSEIQEERRQKKFKLSNHQKPRNNFCFKGTVRGNIGSRCHHLAHPSPDPKSVPEKGLTRIHTVLKSFACNMKTRSR